MNKKQKGYTATELAIVIAFWAAIGIMGGTIYAIVHFLLKFW